MSGNATAGGITYQGRVNAFVYAHILHQERLGWLDPENDIPTAIEAETGGPGDDARVSFGEGLAAIEVQAKHGLDGGAKIDEILDRMRLDADKTHVVLVIDGSSAKHLYTQFADDLERLRGDRKTPLHAEAKRILDADPSNVELLKRLRVVRLDLDNASDSDRKFGVGLVRMNLEDESRALSAWAILESDGSDLIAKQLKRTRGEILTLLRGKLIRVRVKEAPFEQEFRFITEQINKHRRELAEDALARLRDLEVRVEAAGATEELRYRLPRLRAAALCVVGRFKEALTSAQLALDMKPEGVDALVVAAQAALSLQDTDLAKGYAERAIAADPLSAGAWGVRGFVGAERSEQAAEPPDAVAQSVDYRGYAAIAAQIRQDWQAVIEITTGLLQDGERTDTTLNLRSLALATLLRNGTDRPDDIANQVIRLTSEVIDRNESAAAVSEALTLRGLAYREIGQTTEADRDIQRANEVQADNVDAIRYAVQSRLAVDDTQGALRLLSAMAVQDDAMLLAMRSNLRGRSGLRAEAKEDLLRALTLLPEAAEADPARLATADAALANDDPGLAEELLGRMSGAFAGSWRKPFFLARIAAYKGQVNEAVALYREAAGEVGTAERADALSAIAAYFNDLNRPKDVVETLDQIGAWDELPPEVLPIYGRALLRANDLVRAQAIVDGLAARGPLPNWALALAINIALRREDPEAAINHLLTLARSDQATNEVRIVLAKCLIEAHREGDATPYLDALRQATDVTPIERMETAELLQMSGRGAEAIPLAYQAFREAPTDPQMHRAFASLFFRTTSAIPVPDGIGNETHVRLRDASGNTREHTILATPPIEPLRGEMSLADAELAGLVGRHRGDTFVDNAGHWNEHHWVVEEITPAVVYAANDVIAHFGERFPREPNFAQVIRFRDDKEIVDFSEVIAAVSSRAEAVRQTLESYRARVLPFGFVSRAIGISVAEFMEGASADPDSNGPILAEWAAPEGQAASRAAATATTSFVITHSGLKTAADLGILDELATFDVLASRALLEDLEQEAEKARQEVQKGRSTLTDGGPMGMIMSEIKPGDPFLVRRQDMAESALAWIKDKAHIEQRPLNSIREPGSPRETIRARVGGADVDALFLGYERRCPVYADDLGLRGMTALASPTEGLARVDGATVGGAPVCETFSTVALIPELARRGLITPERQDELLLTLVLRHYAFIEPSVGLLVTAVRREPTIGRSGLKAVMEVLGGPLLSAEATARLVARVFRELALHPALTVSLEDVVTLSLESMKTRWDARVVSALVAREAQKELRLLPTALQVVLDRCQSTRS